MGLPWRLTASLTRQDARSAPEARGGLRALRGEPWEPPCSAAQADTGAKLHEAECGGTVSSVAFAPDGSQLVSAAPDWSYDLPGKLTFWSAVSCRKLREAECDDTVLCVAFSPDSRHLATGGHGPARSGKLALWWAATGEELCSASCTGSVNGVAFSPDGTMVATADSGSDDTGVSGKLTLWSSAPGLAPSSTASDDRTIADAVQPEAEEAQATVAAGAAAAAEPSFVGCHTPLQTMSEGTHALAEGRGGAEAVDGDWIVREAVLKKRSVSAKVLASPPPPPPIFRASPRVVSRCQAPRQAPRRRC